MTSFERFIISSQVLDVINSTYTREMISSYGSSLNFETETRRDLYLLKRDTPLKLYKGNFVDVFKNQNGENKTNSEVDSDGEAKPFFYTSNRLHSQIFKFI